MKTNNILLKIFVAITYVGMIIINALANILPINNNTTGDISLAYPNLFAPAAITFSIWGVIYLLLAFYILYQFGLFQKDKGKKNEELFKKINLYFIFTSIANTLWVFAWHYHIIGLSLILIIVILLNLIKISSLLKHKRFSLAEKFFIKAPFSVYFGWITVATIANTTVYLVKLNWNGFGLSDQIWTIIILLVGAIIGILNTFRNKDILYMLVLIWAYIGIYIKHTSITGFNGQYPAISNTVIICNLLFLITIASILFKKYCNKNNF